MKKNMIFVASTLFWGFLLWGKKKIIAKKKDTINKITILNEIQERWMTLRDRNVRLADLLKEKSYRRVVIYGLGVNGDHLAEELLQTDIDVIGMDRKEIFDNYPFPILKPDVTELDVDLFIVTPIFHTEEICKQLRETQHADIITLEELIREGERSMYYIS